MFNPIRTVRTAALALGLLGAATLSAHAAPSHSIRWNGPYIQAVNDGACDVRINGRTFTPNGTVDLYVSYSGDYTGSYEVTLTATRGVFVPGYGLVGGGTFSRLVGTGIQTRETEQVQAYDESSQQWSNTTVSNLYCLG